MGIFIKIDFDEIYAMGIATQDLRTGVVICDLDHVNAKSSCILCKFFMEMNPASAMPGIYGVLPYAASLSNTAFCPPLALYWVAIRELLN